MTSEFAGTPCEELAHLKNVAKGDVTDEDLRASCFFWHSCAHLLFLFVIMLHPVASCCILLRHGASFA